MTLLPAAGASVTLMLYARGFLRLRRRRPDLARVGQAVAFCAGIVLALAAVLSPLDELAETKLLSAHMAQHLLIGDLAPLLLVLGLRGPLALFVVPPGVLRALSRSPLRSAARLVLRPGVALGIWGVAMYAWHVPAAYGAALEHTALHGLEHATLLGAGLLVWTVVLDPARSAGRRAAFAAGVLVAGVPLAEVLLATPPLYPQYAEASGRPFGLTAAEDQARAALMMMAEQIATLGTAALLLLRAHVEPHGSLAPPDRRPPR
jgi:cytochrome c oxidase assembly factor CtaG